MDQVTSVALMGLAVIVIATSLIVTISALIARAWGGEVDETDIVNIPKSIRKAHIETYDKPVLAIIPEIWWGDCHVITVSKYNCSDDYILVMPDGNSLFADEGVIGYKLHNEADAIDLMATSDGYVILREVGNIERVYYA